MSAFLTTGTTTFGAVTTGLLGLLLLVLTIVGSIIFFGFISAITGAGTALLALGKGVLVTTGNILLQAPVLIANGLVDVVSLTTSGVLGFGNFIAAVGTKLLTVFTDVSSFLVQALIFVGNKILTFATFVAGEIGGQIPTLLSKIANALWYAIQQLYTFLSGTIIPAW